MISLAINQINTNGSILSIADKPDKTIATGNNAFLFPI